MPNTPDMALRSDILEPYYEDDKPSDLYKSNLVTGMSLPVPADLDEL